MNIYKTKQTYHSIVADLASPAILTTKICDSEDIIRDPGKQIIRVLRLACNAEKSASICVICVNPRF